MAGFYGVSAYQQTDQSWKTGSSPLKNEKTKAAKKPEGEEAPKNGAVTKENAFSNVSVKNWSPLDSGSSLIPRDTEYGSTVGNVELSDKAKDYYEQLKGKFNNMDFIVVSKDMKSQVKQNAASYGNANNMVVLIGEDELERMATDESFRKKYEGIIQMAKSRLSEFKNSLTSSGASLMNYGMSVDENGKESFFATVEKSQDLQKKRIEKKAAEKKEHKAQEKKKAEKERREERIEEARKKRKAGKAEKETDDEDVEKVDEQKEYITFESSSLDDLISKVSSYSYNNASAKVMTDAERMVGGNIDFRG